MKRSHAIYLLVSFVFLLAAPHRVHAASISLSPAQTVLTVGGQQVINVFLDTEQASVNAVNLIIRYPKIVGITGISKRGSIISLWVQEPSFTGDSIVLIGGIPRGIVTGHALIAQFTVQGRAVGDGSVALDLSSAVLLNDGAGTPASLKTNTLTLKVNARPAGASSTATPEETPTTSSDNRRPAPFSIMIGSDPGVFGGKYFTSFFTTDVDSGIGHYEIREGSASFQIAKSPYLLSDQSRHSVIRVRAYDSAGNWREEVWPGFFKRAWWWITGIFR